MTPQEIFNVVEQTTGIKVTACTQNGKRPDERSAMARRLAILLMNEEGYTLGQISEPLSITKSSTHDAIKLANKQLIKKQQFKDMYLAAVAHIAALGRLAEQHLNGLEMELQHHLIP